MQPQVAPYQIDAHAFTSIFISPFHMTLLAYGLSLDF
jgi:hypothetical protein